MANADKSRELLKQHFDAVRKDIDAIEAKSTPLRAKRDAIMAKIQPFEDEARELAQQIKALEQPVLADLKNELSQLAKALGGKRMSDATDEAA